MSVTTSQFIRKPLYVDAVRVTGANFDEIAAWCQGEVQQDEVPEQGTGEKKIKKFIKVRVHNPKNPRQTKAFVGDWLLYTERGYKVYTNKAFHASFDEVSQLEIEEEPTVSYPYEDGDTTVLGPECFASQDGKVLSWKGINYVPQRSSRTISGGQPDEVIIGDEEVVPGVTANDVVETLRNAEALEEQRGEGLVTTEARETAEESAAVEGPQNTEKAA